MDVNIYAETIADMRSVPVDAVLCFAEAMVGLECAGDVEFALDVALLVTGPAVDDDKVIEQLIEQNPGERRRYRGRHRQNG
jgi:hypothetical protein